MGQTKYEFASSESDSSDKEMEAETRDTWSGKLDFMMSALSFAVGMGNLWRFPYLCYENGGGAFLIPYVVMMLLCGYPLMYLELSLGQYARQGIISVWKACPIFEGIGWGMLSVSAFTCIYYNMTIAWCFRFLFASFASDVPWRSCDNEWNTPACTTFESATIQANCSHHNGTWFNQTCLTASEYLQAVNQSSTIDTAIVSPKKISASEEYFHNHVLGLSEGLHEFGGVRLDLAGCLFLCWFLVFVSLAKGIQVSGKVTYVTALFPYVILVIILIRGVTLDGAAEGVLYYITPDWPKLLSAKVWADAAMQAFFSLSLCWGGMITLASYNKPNNNCYRDALVVATGDMLTSIFSGFVIFVIIGYMAAELGVPVNQVVAQGPGLAFIVYPEVVTKLPVAPLWSALFMVMLINVGLGTQMGTISTIQTTILDLYPATLNKGKRPQLVLLGICITAFLLGLNLTTNGGAYLLVLLDTYCASYALLALALSECIALGWVYGVDRFSKDIEQMVGFKPGLGWKLCWRYLTPAVVVFLIVFVLMDFRRTSYGAYTFPVTWEVIFSMITFISVFCVPAVAIINIITCKEPGNLFQRVRFLCSPSPEWRAISVQRRSSSTEKFMDAETGMDKQTTPSQKHTSL